MSDEEDTPIQEVNEDEASAVNHDGDEQNDEHVDDHAANDEEVKALKARRKQLRAKITRSIKRIEKSIQNNVSAGRLKRELNELNKEISDALEIHNQMYELTPEEEHERMDLWEGEMYDDKFTVEENVESYLSSASDTAKSKTEMEAAARRHRPTTRSMTVEATIEHVPRDKIENVRSVPSDNEIEEQDNYAVASTTDKRNEQDSVNNKTKSRNITHVASIQPGDNKSSASSICTDSADSFDSWIDCLIEYEETVIERMSNVSITDVLYRLEAGRSMPNIELQKFDGNPIKYVEFLEIFKLHVHDKQHLTDDMRMVQLKSHLEGEALMSVSGLGNGGIMYSTALKIIKEQFGQRSVIARAWINKLIKGSKIPTNNRQAIRDLSHDIVNCVSVLRRLNYFSDANSTDNLRQIIQRLPDYLINKWKTRVTEIRDKDGVPTLEHINLFLRKEVKSMFDPDFGDIEVGRKRDNQTKGETRRGVHATQSVRPKEGKMKCFICAEEHKVNDCTLLINSTCADRVDLVRKKRLCFGCLRKNHVFKDCRSKRTCDINGCTKMHHHLLHTDPPSASSASAGNTDAILPVVRVYFKASNGRIREGNVLIDSGAGATIIRKDFARSLGLQGKNESLQLAVVGGETLNQKLSKRVKFTISPMDGNEQYDIEAQEIEKTVLNVPPLNRPWLQSFVHLSDIRFTHKGGPIDLILGVQYSHLHTDEEIRYGKPFEPLAKRSKLGWYVFGPDKESSSPIYYVNYMQKVDMTSFYDMETLGVRAPDCSCPSTTMSHYDRKALEMLESSCYKAGNRYVLSLPWKHDRGVLPDNYPMAKRRLENLEKSLLKNKEKASMYSEAMQQYIDNKWAVPVQEKELQSDIKGYYLPHHGVYRPDKTTTPLRIVFDPASQCKGISLNSCLLKGPNLIGDLLGVLLRFRERKVAFVGDISKMFLQILLSYDDSHVHRFLWRNLGTQESPQIYRLTRVTFGDKPSPDMASFIMLKIANEFCNTYEKASLVLKKDRYVDDLIHSCETHEEAIEIMGHLDKMLASGSFAIKKWFCSTHNKEDHPKTETLINLDKGDTLKALGVLWDSKSDNIHFQVNLSDKMLHEKLTKRQVLSKMSSFYDPLGLASATTVKCKIAMQKIWRLDLGWDDKLPEDEAESWSKLFQEMANLNSISIPRSVKPRNAQGKPELHVFCDASIHAYGAVAYILWPTDSTPTVTLLASKVRVAPLKTTTIPRLELMAAIVASRLAKTITEEFRDQLTVTLWSDSQIVLHWLRSESVSFKVFVGVRVAEIQSTWNHLFWKFVPTDLNPADDLSRGIDVEMMTGRWLNGPEFLRKSKPDWPEQPAVFSSKEDKETKRIVAVVVKQQPIIDLRRFSNWNKLVHVISYCMRFINNLKSKITGTKQNKGALKPDELDEAKMYIIKVAQGDFENWRESCKDLTPFEKSEVVYVGGRLDKSALPYEQCHPIILPTKSIVSKLIMQECHRVAGHPGSERTLAESRHNYWIVRGRRLAQNVVRNCVVCRKIRQPAHLTLMGDLPQARLKVHSPVFSTTGIDLFGPFNLRYGRNKTNKAWGALFTCATTRAIHLEIVDGLSSQAFLQSLRRFVALHGWPTTIITDNGTSFVGTETELRKLLVEGRKQIEDYAVLHKVKWIFITP